VLFGAIGDQNRQQSDAKVRPEQGLLRLRKELGLCKYSTIKPYPALLDLLLKKGKLKVLTLLF
jgi:3-isopropylmalate dehydrogenase